jgi:hypothetical protein
MAKPFILKCLHPFYSIVFAIILLAELLDKNVVAGGIIVISVAIYAAARVSLNKK